jgi:hypothetical protein
MLKPRRTISYALSALVACVSVALTPLPASAITPVVPSWPAQGHVPVGPNCEILMSGAVGTLFRSQYGDTGKPTVVDVLFNGGTTVVVPPAGTSFTLSATVTEACSGVTRADPIVVHNNAFTVPVLAPVTTDVFHGAWAARLPVTPDSAGVYRVPQFFVGRRYDSFVVDAFFLLTSSVASSNAAYSVGAWSMRNYYVLRQSALTLGAPTSVRKGRAATLTGLLRYATAAGFRPDNGEKVVVQTRVGKTGRWITRATVTASSTGATSTRIVFTKTSQVRLVHGAVLSGRFTAGVVSAVKTVKVT